MRNRPDIPVEVLEALSDLERSVLSLSKTSQTVNKLVSDVERTLLKNSENMERDIQTLSEISRNFQKFMEDFKPIVEELSRASVEYRKLIENMSHINRQLYSIENIASHIELVAINASIEASRAGESGRTFAIVANEIRDMAKKTFKILHEIKELEREIEPTLKNIQGNIEAMEEVRKKLDTLVNDINRVIKISDELGEVNRQQSEIIKELKGLSGISKALERVFSVLSGAKERVAKGIVKLSATLRGRGS
ncbi:methyl-accepting chemotaxis protein [Thermovibrio ammonificans]|uniref:Methyl-accepting chemotaxis sensory transducer n=1 Tax=Thermovibrio ammonificans (strain DSM 15698 / JCM 12110 / HB-1) TaxID=648996 RepID=E8T4Y7_THEA1|nr:methyl-accepting chemotaxis protein [Thermovibrio ammonificans]ADU97519.1 methyl-accepting chemotaxis sensory transducer [Thermovibrio ammonificans HB-1]